MRRRELSTILKEFERDMRNILKMIFVWFAYMALMQGVIITRIQT